MLSKKELISILAITIVLGFAISLVESFEIFLMTSLIVLIIISINLIAKKIVAFHLDSEIETRIWEVKRFGWRASHYFKKPIPAGILFPLIIKILSLGYVTWMASLIFDVKPKVYRAAKRHGLYKFTEMTEFHIGLIAAAGIAANLFFAIAGYLIGYPEFARLNIYYSLFNLLPLSDLDGNKIFFGNLVLWSFLATLTLIGLFLSMFMI